MVSSLFWELKDFFRDFGRGSNGDYNKRVFRGNNPYNRKPVNSSEKLNGKIGLHQDLYFETLNVLPSTMEHSCHRIVT